MRVGRPAGAVSMAWSCSRVMVFPSSVISPLLVTTTRMVFSAAGSDISAPGAAPVGAAFAGFSAGGGALFLQPAAEKVKARAAAHAANDHAEARVVRKARLSPRHR